MDEEQDTLADEINQNVTEGTDKDPSTVPNDKPLVDVDSPVDEKPKQTIDKPSRLAVLKNPAVLLAILLALLSVAAVVMLVANGEDEMATNDYQVTTQEKVETLGATIASIEGNVQLSQDGEKWTDAEGGESLANLDYVRTLDSSRAIVLFDDGSVARLDGNTQLYLSSLEATALEVTLVNGQVYSRVVESENQTFTVVTSNERFQALGTAYKTFTDGSKDVLDVYQSSVKVESEDLDVAEGNKYDTESKEQGAIDLASLDSDEFAQWNKQKDSESNEFKDKLGVLKDREEETPAPTSAPGPSDGITLSAIAINKGVKLSWTLNGVSSTNGFKVVRDKTDSTPSYKENSANYAGDGNSTSYTWKDQDGGTYYYRVCIYRDGGTCDTYSNSVQATSPFVEKDPVVSGVVNLSIDGTSISWSLAGGTAPHGYKVLLGTAESPTYPENSIKYTSNMSLTLPEKAAGTYYVRVCKYTNGTQDAGCVDYSNQVEYVVAP